MPKKPLSSPKIVKNGKDRPRQACLWQGCFELASLNTRHHVSGYCPSHGLRMKYLRWDRPRQQRLYREKRSLLLKEWLSRDHRRFNRRRVRDGNLPPLTPKEERLYQQELTLLMHQEPPKSQVQYAQLCGRASTYARAGGRAAYQKMTGIASRIAGRRRKWLREASYDPLIVDGLKEASPSARKQLTKLKGKVY